MKVSTVKKTVLNPWPDVDAKIFDLVQYSEKVDS